MTKGDILLLHGAFVGGWVFERMRGELNRRGWKTHAPDLPFHGSDFAGAAPHADLARQGLAEYRTTLTEEVHRLTQPAQPAPVLIGHSLGGLLAQQLAAQNLARALVLLAPVAPWGILPRTRWEMETIYSLMKAHIANKPVMPNFQVAAEYSMDRIPPALQRDIFARLVPESGRALYETLLWWMDWTAASYVSARRVQVPILVLCGSDDKVTPPATCRAVARRYPGRAVYREIAGLSHFTFGEPQEDAVIGTVADWLDEHAL